MESVNYSFLQAEKMKIRNTLFRTMLPEFLPHSLYKILGLRWFPDGNDKLFFSVSYLEIGKQTPYSHKWKQKIGDPLPRVAQMVLDNPKDIILMGKLILAQTECTTYPNSNEWISTEDNTTRKPDTASRKPQFSKFTFLGTSCAVHTRERNHSGFAIALDSGKTFLVDCGESIQKQILDDRSTVKLGSIHKIFITHLHLDHVSGLPPLLCTLSQTSIDNIQIIGPKGIGKYVRNSLMDSYTKLSFSYQIVELISGGRDDLRPDILHQNEEVPIFIPSYQGLWDITPALGIEMNITAGPLVHTVPCVGYVFTEENSTGTLNKAKLVEMGLNPRPAYCDLKNGRSIVFTNKSGHQQTIHPDDPDIMGSEICGRRLTVLGDTCDSSKIVPLAINSEWLIHEATYTNKMTKEWCRDQGHSNVAMAMNFADKICANKLYLTHFSSRNNKVETYGASLNGPVAADDFLTIDAIVKK